MIVVFDDKYEPGVSRVERDSNGQLRVVGRKKIGGNHSDVICQPGSTISLNRALATRYSTDAHAICYQLPGMAGYRLNKGTLELFRTETGITPKLTALFVDLDRDNHQQPWPNCPKLLTSLLAQWMARLAVDPVTATAGCYLTRGGLRLVWPLSRPIDITSQSEKEIERCMLGVYRRIADAGIAPVKSRAKIVYQGACTSQDVVIDKSCAQWTRFFRLPFVVRDGQPQTYPADFSRMAPLDLPSISPFDFSTPSQSKSTPTQSPLTQPSQASSILPAAPPQGMSGLANETHRFLSGGAPQGDRSNALFRAACDMHGNGIDLVNARPLLLHAAQFCNPPLLVHEADTVIDSAYSQPRTPSRRATTRPQRIATPVCVPQSLAGAPPSTNGQLGVNASSPPPQVSPASVATKLPTCNQVQGRINISRQFCPTDQAAVVRALIHAEKRDLANAVCSCRSKKHRYIESTDANGNVTQRRFSCKKPTYCPTCAWKRAMDRANELESTISTNLAGHQWLAWIVVAEAGSMESAKKMTMDARRCLYANDLIGDTPALGIIDIGFSEVDRARQTDSTVKSVKIPLVMLYAVPAGESLAAFASKVASHLPTGMVPTDPVPLQLQPTDVSHLARRTIEAIPEWATDPVAITAYDLIFKNARVIDKNKAMRAAWNKAASPLAKPQSVSEFDVLDVDACEKSAEPEQAYCDASAWMKVHEAQQRLIRPLEKSIEDKRRQIESHKEKIEKFEWINQFVSDLGGLTNINAAEIAQEKSEIADLSNEIAELRQKWPRREARVRKNGQLLDFKPSRDEARALLDKLAPAYDAWIAAKNPAEQDDLNVMQKLRHDHHQRWVKKWNARQKRILAQLPPENSPLDLFLAELAA